MSLALEVTQLSKAFARVQAVDQVSFSVSAGEVVALLGPNGSGKTTCLRCIAGLLRPQSGLIALNGHDLQRDYRRARMQFSYLPQQASFPPSLRVSEVLEFHARLRGVPLARTGQALHESGVSREDAGRFIGQLSGGMRQRVSLAVACLSGAPLMLLDEPTANLDPEMALNFRRIAREWRAAGRAIVLSTHVLTDVEELADRVVVLVAGRKVAEQSIGAMRAQLSESARLRVDVGQATERHCAEALAAGAIEARANSHAVVIMAPVERRMAILERLRAIGEVNRFDTEQPSLEDIYLQYVKEGQNE